MKITCVVIIQRVSYTEGRTINPIPGIGENSFTRLNTFTWNYKEEKYTLRPYDPIAKEL